MGIAIPYESVHAPWTADGPLPPGLTVAHLRSAYRAASKLTPARLLGILRKKTSATAAKRLRELLDDPAHRRTLAEYRDENDSAALHQVLYWWLVHAPHSAAVYRRVIKDAEEPIDQHSRRIVAAKFARLVQLEANQRQVATEEIKPGSEDEALALLVLAYGLFQPECAQELCEALFGLGPGFVGFFGATARRERLPVFPVSAPPPPTPTPAHRPRVSAPQHAPPSAAAASPAPVPPPGARTAHLLRLVAAREAAMARRRELAAACAFDDGAFAAARAAEVETERAHDAALRELAAEADALLDRVATGLATVGIRLELDGLPGAATPDAGWLDEHASALEDLLASAAALHERTTALAEVGVSAGPAEPMRAVRDVAEAVAVIDARAALLEAALAAAEDWKQRLGALRERLADCGDARPAPSLASDDLAEGFAYLLRRSVLDDNLAGLAPLLIRWLGEHGPGFDAPGVAAGIADFLALRSRDPSAHDLALSFLPIGVLQDLLRTGDDQLARHVVLYAFRQSLATRSCVFFDAIWGYAGWSGRSSSVGEELARLFDALRKLAVSRGPQHAFDVLVRGAEPAGGAEDVTERSRAAACAELNRRLGNPSRMTGHYFELRRIASDLFFRPLQPLVMARRRAEVWERVAHIERLHVADEALEQVIERFVARGHDRHDLRESHRTNARRYIAHQLELLKDWVRDESLDGDRAEPRADDPLTLEVAHCLEPVLSAAEANTEPAPAWSESSLRHGIAELVLAARAGEYPDPAAVAFGELTDDSLPFLIPSGTAAADPGGAGLWTELGLGAPGPHHLRLWVAHVREKRGASWTDVLQDAIRAKLLENDRSPYAVVRQLIGATELEAANACRGWPGYDDAATLAALDEAARQDQRKRAAESLLFALDERLSAVRKLGLRAEEAALLRSVDTHILEGFSAATRLDLDTAGVCSELAHRAIGACEAAVKKRVQGEKARIAEVREWLHAAGAVPAGADVLALEDERRRIVALAHARRRHLASLEELERSDAPDSLRAAVRHLRQTLDHPGRWPTEAGSANATTFLEALAEIGGAWWRALPVLRPEDDAYVRMHSIAETLARRLPEEVAALAEERAADAAPCLALLFERESGTIAGYHALLRRAGLLWPASDGGVPPPAAAGEIAAGPEERTPPLTAEAVAPRRQLAEVEARLATTPGPIGTGADVHAAFEAFRARNAAACRDAATRAWRWARRDGKEAIATEAATLFAWASAVREPPEARLTALGALLELGEGALKRTGLDEERFATEWREAWGYPAGARTANISDDLLRIAASSAAAPERERFARLVRGGHVRRLTRMWWNAVRNQGDATTKSRTALLRLLFDFDQDDLVVSLLDDQELRKYARPFLALARRAAAEPSSRLHSALQLSLRTLVERVPIRPFREFATSVVRDLGVTKTVVELAVLGELELRAEGGYRLVVEVRPDESDPPIQLRVAVAEQDFRAVGEASQNALGDAPLLLERRELEFVVEPVTMSGAQFISLQAVGESASGQRIEHSVRLPVPRSDGGQYRPISADELLEIYEGCRGKPVTHEAFIGRDGEIRRLEAALVNADPGAVILYGARRLGKTSLLDEVRRRFCVSHRPDASTTLFLVVPVDQFQYGTAARTGRTFASAFFKLIADSVRADSKNERFRELLRKLGVHSSDLAKAARLPEDFEDMPFLAQLRQYLGQLMMLAQGRVKQIVLVFDEFDKLLESYREGLHAEVHEIVNQLRRAATEEHLGVVLAGSDLMRRILGEYRSAMFGSAVELELSCFDAPGARSDAERIIVPDRIRTFREFRPEVIDQIIAVTGGHPLYMQLVAAASAFVSERRSVTPGTVTHAIQELMRDNVLAGRISHPRNLVTQPLQALGLLDSAEDETLSRLLLLRLAYHTSLEKPWAQWARMTSDEALLSLRPEATWTRLRERLEAAKALMRNGKGLWSFRFPIIGEALRIGLDAEFETLEARATREPAA